MESKAKRADVVRALARLISQSGLNEARCNTARRAGEARAWNVVAQMLRFEAEQVAISGPRFQPRLWDDRTA